MAAESNEAAGVYKVDRLNSSTTPLSGAAVFTGATTECDEYVSVHVSVYSNVAGTLSMQFSSDGTNWDITQTYTVLGGGGRYFSTALPPTLAIPNARRLGSTISGTPDTIVLVVTPITNNITVDTAITWREVS